MNTATARRPRLYSAMTAAELAGLTYRQIDYWARCGYVVPEVAARGSGSRRLYTAQQVAVLAVIARVAGTIRVGRLSILAALLNDWPLQEWATAGWLLVTADGEVWLPEDGDPPPVGTAVALGRLIPDEIRKIPPPRTYDRIEVAPR